MNRCIPGVPCRWHRCRLILRCSHKYGGDPSKCNNKWGVVGLFHLVNPVSVVILNRYIAYGRTHITVWYPCKCKCSSTTGSEIFISSLSWYSQVWVLLSIYPTLSFRPLVLYLRCWCLLVKSRHSPPAWLQVNLQLQGSRKSWQFTVYIFFQRFKGLELLEEPFRCSHLGPEFQLAFRLN